MLLKKCKISAKISKRFELILYLHIPFCDSKCFYCSFNSYTDKDSVKKAYSQAILDQLASELTLFNPKNGEISSLFVGGGTPSTLEPQLLKPFMDMIKPYISPNAEMTTEANPNSASAYWLNEMKELGFNRVSFGVQSFDDEKLKFLGRIHDKNSALRAIENAYNIGFANISIDLIYNTKFDTKKLLSNDVAIAASLPINHLSAYSLTLEEKTKFYKQPNSRKESLVLTKFLFKSLIEMGFSQYEISNFARGYECYHNKQYWKHDNYIGTGCGAVGFLNNQRLYPSSNLEEYLKNPCQTRAENLSQSELLMEKIFLGLRSNIGVELSLLNAKKVDILAREKKAFIKNGRLYNQNYLLSDEMALFLS